ncbi:DUF3368 domain-containing protein [Nodosilinea nodulosa]|uniref:DUF3368 domain-containing protein n=1 Tax=Nodosilinea nodulosa TaxID=416001 RepID=UPI0002F923EF|nr:DUF3368 domain-containing protein [Nodosilinea nodulosa]
MNRAVFNSSCLIGLERIQQLDLLPQVFSVILIPEAVRQEVGLEADWLTVQAVNNRSLVRALQAEVDDGEAEAIALALELDDGVITVLDDQKARRLAKRLGLHLMGTVGVLLRAKRQGAIAQIKPILDALLQADFRISAAIVRKALELAGEAQL